MTYESSYKLVKTDGVVLCCLKRNDHLTIALPIRNFVNREKNYHFAMQFESNHKPTRFSKNEDFELI